MAASLRQIRYVLSVQGSGSIAKASRELNMSQSSVLAAIDAAENDLGARIFDRRKGRGVVLTTAGERYLAAAQRLLAAEQDFHHSLRATSAPNSPLRIGCFEPFGPIMMIEVLSTLRRKIGFFEITLLETDQITLKRALDRGEIDVAVVYDLGPDFDCSMEYVGRCPPHAMVHVDDPLARFDEISINDLCDAPIALLDLPLTATYLMTLFDNARKKPTIGFRSSNYETVIRAVAAGFGATVLNAWPTTPRPFEVNTKRLHFRETLPAPNIVTADHYGTQKPPNLLAFIAELKAHIDQSYSSRLPHQDAKLVSPR
ncbi:MAG: LysR family transcriptional regulator [Paracoccaceae bacterium]